VLLAAILVASALRSYAGGIAGQDGLEDSPAAFIARQMAVWDEVRRVLRSDGTAIVNLGDTYAGGGRGPSSEGSKQVTNQGSLTVEPTPDCGIPIKSLCGIPWRFALAMTDRGWVWRNTVVWHKRNPMPSSARDRMRCSWEPCFVFAKTGKYYSDLEGVRQQAVKGAAGSRFDTGKTGERDGGDRTQEGYRDAPGANPGDCLDGTDWPEDWLDLTAQPSKVKHYAMYPVRLPLWFMRWLLPRAVCSKCGKAWVRHGKVSYQLHHPSRNPGKIEANPDNHHDNIRWPQSTKIVETLGWVAACTCNADATGATVYDVYGGPGTSACAAEWLWTHPDEGLDTVLADARMTPTRPGANSKFAEGDGSQRPEYAKARMVKTGTPTAVLQPWLPGRAVMLDLDPECEAVHPARLAECFKSLGRKQAEPTPQPQQAQLFGGTQ